MKNATRPAIFKWRQTAPELVLCAVRWYVRYSLSLRDVEELLAERGLEVDHTTIWRWVQRYGPELEQRLRRHLKPTNFASKDEERWQHHARKQEYASCRFITELSAAADATHSEDQTSYKNDHADQIQKGVRADWAAPEALRRKRPNVAFDPRQV